MGWPPPLELLQADLRGRVVRGEPGLADSTDTGPLQLRLDAAVEFVERVRAGEFNFAGDPASSLPDPSADLVLGTLMLAGRLKWRLRSPDALVDAGAMGAARIPSFDPDIERLLRIGRHQKPRVG